MLVYRIENVVTRLGPFSCSAAWEWHMSTCYKRLDKHNNSSDHPTVYKDGIFQHRWDDEYNEEKRKYFCGFDSEEKLQAWFVNLDGVGEHGFVLAVYDVEELFVKHGKSGKQLMFKKCEAVHLHDIVLS